MKTFLCRYRIGPSEWWSFEIKAESFADAEMRLRAIQQSGRVDGECVMKVLAPLGFFAMLAVWWRNRWAAS